MAMNSTMFTNIRTLTYELTKKRTKVLSTQQNIQQQQQQQQKVLHQTALTIYLHKVRL